MICLGSAAGGCAGDSSKETRRPVPAAPGQPARTDYEYERNGTANQFLWFKPLTGRRHVKVTDRTERSDQAMPQSPDPRPAHIGRESRRLGKRPLPRRLAIHHPQRAHTT